MRIEKRNSCWEGHVTPAKPELWRLRQEGSQELESSLGCSERPCQERKGKEGRKRGRKREEKQMTQNRNLAFTLPLPMFNCFSFFVCLFFRIRV